MGGDGDDVVKGASGNDYVVDNSGSNTVHGGEGNDHLVTENGNNEVFGDDGNDVIILSQGNDIADGGAGDDLFVLNIHSGHGRWSLDGGAGEDRLSASGNISGLKIESVEQLYLSGALTIDPDLLNSFAGVHNVAGNEIRFSHAGDFTWKRAKDDLSATATLHGSMSTDHIDLSASKGFWFVDAGGGNDTVTLGKHPDGGFPDHDTALGGDGNDRMTGGASNDSLAGGGGNDVLIDSAGSDEFEGGAGKDTFVFFDLRGQTEIRDFATKGASHDVIDLSAITSVRNFDDLMAHHIVQYDGFLMIWFGHNNVALDGLTVADLNASDFRF